MYRENQCFLKQITDFFALQIQCIVSVEHVSYSFQRESIKYMNSGRISCNTPHKSLKQEPFVLNFLQISYIHSWHLRSHSNVPLSFPNVEPRVFRSTETTVIPKSALGKGKITQVFQDLWRVLWLWIPIQIYAFPAILPWLPGMMQLWGWPPLFKKKKTGSVHSPILSRHFQPCFDKVL